MGNQADVESAYTGHSSYLVADADVLFHGRGSIVGAAGTVDVAVVVDVDGRPAIPANQEPGDGAVLPGDANETVPNPLM